MTAAPPSSLQPPAPISSLLEQRRALLAVYRAVVDSSIGASSPAGGFELCSIPTVTMPLSFSKDAAMSSWPACCCAGPRSGRRHLRRLRWL